MGNLKTCWSTRTELYRLAVANGFEILLIGSRFSGHVIEILNNFEAFSLYFWFWRSSGAALNLNWYRIDFRNEKLISINLIVTGIVTQLPNTHFKLSPFQIFIPRYFFHSALLARSQNHYRHNIHIQKNALKSKYEIISFFAAPIHHHRWEY